MISEFRDLVLGDLGGPFALLTDWELNHTRRPAPTQAHFTGCKTRIRRQAGKGGVNCAQGGFLVRTIRPSLHRMQAMVFRCDPLVAHAPLLDDIALKPLASDRHRTSQV